MRVVNLEPEVTALLGRLDTLAMGGYGSISDDARAASVLLRHLLYPRPEEGGSDATQDR